MEVLDGILSTGESSRLHQSLVYRDQVASQASSFVDLRQGRGTLAAYAILASGQSAEAGEAALRREIARFRDAPVSAAELSEAKNELLTAALARARDRRRPGLGDRRGGDRRRRRGGGRPPAGRGSPR